MEWERVVTALVFMTAVTLSEGNGGSREHAVVLLGAAAVAVALPPTLRAAGISTGSVSAYLWLLLQLLVIFRLDGGSASGRRGIVVKAGGVVALAVALHAARARQGSKLVQVVDLANFAKQDD